MIPIVLVYTVFIASILQSFDTNCLPNESEIEKCMLLLGKISQSFSVHMSTVRQKNPSLYA